MPSSYNLPSSYNRTPNPTKPKNCRSNRRHRIMEINREHLITIKSAHQIRDIPENVIRKILSKLPVKSLLKFRCVSKSWCSLISSKSFIKTHLDNSTKDPTFAHHKIISAFPVPKCTLKRYSLPSLSCERVLRPNYNDDSIKKWIDLLNVLTVSVVGSCNGLICLLFGGRHFVLWNPTMRKYKELPKIDEMKGRFSTKYGFGFDEISGDYKVYAVFCRFLPERMYHVIGQVYSLKTNSWKPVKENDSHFDIEGKFVNGKLHWIRYAGLRLRWDINCFDLRNEDYGIVDQPSNVKGEFIASLGELRGCLCVACDYEGKQLDVWIWKQYGDNDSWDKAVTIPYHCHRWKGPFSTPLYILPHGEILFVYGSSFLVYDPKLNRFSKSLPKTVGSTLCLYVQSLVSLTSDGEQESQP